MNDSNVLSYGSDPIGEKYIITIDGEHFHLNPFKDQFTEEEKTKINTIKTYLETENNLNLILPKTTYHFYNPIITAIRARLVNDIEDISSGDFHLIVEKVGLSEVTSVATHNQSPTPFIITVGDEHEFTLHLNQDEFTKEQKNNAIKNYLENMDTDNFILPKDNYDNDNDILNAIKEEFVRKVNKFTTRDYDLITKKESSPEVVEVKSNEGTEVTPYEISVGGEISTLRLKQSQFTKEEILKINIIEEYFDNNPPAYNPYLPKGDYRDDASVLSAIKLELVNNIEGISNKDSYLIIKKPSEEDFSASIPLTHNNEIFYIINVGENEFKLHLAQFEYSKQEQIEKIKEQIDILNTENNLNFILPQTTNIDNDDIILKEIQEIVSREIDVYGVFVDLIVKKEGEEDITSIASFDEDYTIYKVTVGEYEYSFKFKKEKYSKEEKINKIREYLPKDGNYLDIIIQRKNYYTSFEILKAIRKTFFENIKNKYEDFGSTYKFTTLIESKEERH
jgi:hypothetical protein